MGRGDRYNPTKATAGAVSTLHLGRGSQGTVFFVQALARGSPQPGQAGMPTDDATAKRSDENAAGYSEFVGRLRQAGYAGISPEAAVAGFRPSTGTEVIRKGLAEGVCATVNHGSAFVFSEVTQIPGLLKVWQSQFNSI